MVRHNRRRIQTVPYKWNRSRNVGRHAVRWLRISRDGDRAGVGTRTSPEEMKPGHWLATKWQEEWEKFHQEFLNAAMNKHLAMSLANPWVKNYLSTLQRFTLRPVRELRASNNVLYERRWYCQLALDRWAQSPPRRDKWRRRGPRRTRTQKKNASVGENWKKCHLFVNKKK